MDKKILAKEWIIFIISFLFGLFIVPMMVYYFVLILLNIKGASMPIETNTLSKFYIFMLGALFDGDYSVLIFVFGPYVFVQFIRSIIWSVKNLRGD